jgi:hypothetical protein
VAYSFEDPNTGTSPGSFSPATGIDASGQIASGFSDANGVVHGCLL